MDIIKKAAYLQGLSEGFQLDESKPENKLLKELLALVSDLADKVVTLEKECGELREYIEEACRGHFHLVKSPHVRLSPRNRESHGALYLGILK